MDVTGREAQGAPAPLAIMGEGRLHRGPQPSEAYGLPDAVRQQLEAAPLAADRPLLAVDVDEVLLDLAAHLGRWMEGEGWRLALTEHRLDGAISRIECGRRAEPEEVKALIGDFFAAEAESQAPIPGAAEALAALAERAQILILTNVPLAQREARIRCLRAHGVDYPLIANSGGKGRALRWLWDRTTGPVAFIDDSDGQLASARARAPEVFRLHFVASEMLRRVAGEAPNAQAGARDWEEARRILEGLLAT